MDSTDIQICLMLASNSRISYREIGDALNLSVNSIHKRIQTLVSSGIIKEFIAVPSLRLLDATVVMVFGRSKSGSMKDTIDKLGANPNTYTIILAAGNHIYVHGIIRKISEMERYISFVAERGMMEGPDVAIIGYPEGSDISMSRSDYRIMQSLSNNSRKELSEVASELGLSTRTVKRRLDRMVGSGAIHLTIDFNPAASGTAMAILHLTIKGMNDKEKARAHILNNHKDNLLSLVSNIENHPETLLMNAWANNMKELKEFQDGLEATGLFRSIVPQIFYDSFRFESWRDRIISEGSSPIENRPGI